MGDEDPKLYSNKPKKGQLKHGGGESSPPLSAAARSYTMGPPPPPPPSPKEPFLRRYKFIVPLVLAVNLAYGAYLFMGSKKDTSTSDEEVNKNAPSTPASTTAAVPAVTEFAKPRDPIPKDQQRELFKWILEEKRKIKPKDSEEKKRIDEEKALLKQFIRAKSIPNI